MEIEKLKTYLGDEMLKEFNENIKQKDFPQDILIILEILPVKKAIESIEILNSILCMDFTKYQKPLEDQAQGEVVDPIDRKAMEEIRKYNEREHTLNRRHNLLCTKCGSSQWIYEKGLIAFQKKCVCGNANWISIEDYNRINKRNRYITEFLKELRVQVFDKS